MKKKIQDIKVKKRKKIKTHYNSSVEIGEIVNKKIFVKKKIPRGPRLPKKNNTNKIIIILFITILISSIVFWSSILLENVNIIITKKHQIFNLDKYSLIAQKDINSNIPFETMIISDEKNQKVKFSKSEKISQKAKGSIILYNEYSKNKQKIRVNTYVSNTKGKVYLTDKAVTIPGYKVVKDKIIPGSVSVNITSFLPGSTYNSTDSDFTINAFRGTKKFKQIYGKLKSDITNGAQGTRYLLSKDDLINLDKKVNISLRYDLITKVNRLIPKDYIFYPSASRFSYTKNEDFLSPTENGNILIKGTLYAVIFKKDKLDNFFKKNLLSETPKEELNLINISNLDNLTFKFTDSKQEVNKNIDKFKFTLTGKLDFIWNPNLLNNKNILLGISKNKLNSIFKSDVGIENASVRIFPPWQSYLPTKESKINIIVK